MKHKSELQTYLLSGYPALYAVTHEDERTLKSIHDDCSEIQYGVYIWTASKGLRTPSGEYIELYSKKHTTDPMAALACANETEGTGSKMTGTYVLNKSVLVMRDFHLFLKKSDPALTAMVKDFILLGRKLNRTMIVTACSNDIPAELAKLFTVVEFNLPTKSELLDVAKTIAKTRGVELNGNTDAVLDAGSGLTITEFTDAVSASITEHNDIVASMITDIKEKALKSGGILEVIKPGVTFDKIGGMKGLKEWVRNRKDAFTKKARDYGLPLPRGVCLFGVQGAGKSLATKAIAAELNCPLLRLDIGRLFSQYVGSSESNVRNVINQIEAHGLCCVQIDEIDKGFAGMTGGVGDSGTTRRVGGTFLTWMAEKTTPAFIIATANSVTHLPPELLRKGRWDEIFFIDLPSREERIETWKVQILWKNRNPDNFDVNKLADATLGWTGAEIESLFADGLYEAFNCGREPDTEMLLSLSKQTMPLSKTMNESISALRNWSTGRARLASGHSDSVPDKKKVNR